MELEETGYKDVNGRIFKVGDIVHNPCIGDYWIVGKTTKRDKEIYNLEDPYYLALYGDKDYYVMDISEPAGFDIMISLDEENYYIYHTEIQKLFKAIKESEGI